VDRISHNNGQRATENGQRTRPHHALISSTSGLSHSGHVGRRRRASKTLWHSRHSNTEGSLGRGIGSLLRGGVGARAGSDVFGAGGRRSNHDQIDIAGIT